MNYVFKYEGVSRDSHEGPAALEFSNDTSVPVFPERARTFSSIAHDRLRKKKYLYLWRTVICSAIVILLFLYSDKVQPSDPVRVQPYQSTREHVSASTTEIRPPWTCKAHDQLSWCFYFRSLCLDRQGGLLLVTNLTSKHKQPVNLLNDLTPSPWHIPDVHDLSKSSFGRYDVPYRSFFKSAHYDRRPSSSKDVQGWSLVAAFDSDSANIYHYMNTLHASFVARLYEIGGLNERRLHSSSTALLDLNSTDSEFNHAYLFRPSPTSWQTGYGTLCLGNSTKFVYNPSTPQVADFGNNRYLCFEKAIIPGAALELADGLVSSVIFREHAASLLGIRVPDVKRNLITIFDRSIGNRKIVNIADLKSRIEVMASDFEVVVVDWDGEVDFKTQALHMARTRIMITTHGSVLNHNVFMETQGVVMELNGYQFTYPLDEKIVLSRGNHYLRYEESLQNTRHQGYDWGQDPFGAVTTRACMRVDACLLARRDADVRVNITIFEDYFRRALSLVT